MKKATINDVAKLAKVGKTSVSRYLNGELNLLSEDLQKRIKAAIKELDYRPNQIARSLKRGKTKLIAYIVPDITNPYSVEVMQGIEKGCQEKGYSLLVFNSNNDLNKESNYLKLLSSYNVEGVIIHPIKSERVKATPEHLPIIFIDRKIKDHSYFHVGLDNIQSTTLAINYLISQGFDSFLFVSEEINGISTRIERVETFKKVVQQYSNTNHSILEIKEYEQNQYYQNQLKEQINDFYQKYLNQKKVILSINGAVTLNITLTLKTLGIKIGKDIGLLSFDDPKWAEIIADGITCIRQPTHQIGLTAANLILKQIENRTKTEHIELLFPGELIIRNSTP